MERFTEKFSLFRIPDEGREIREYETSPEFKIYRVQLEFVRRLALKGKESVFLAMDQYTNFSEKLGDDILVNSEDTSKVLEIRKRLRSNIDKLSQTVSLDSPEWTEQAFKYVSDAYSEIATFDKGVKMASQSGTAGTLAYETGIADKFRAKDFGLSPGSKYMQLHVPMFAFSQDKNPQAGLKYQLQNLAELLQTTDYKDIDAVIGSSWLMSTPIMRRLGFTIVAKETEVSQDPYEERKQFKERSYWYQLFDRDGNIKKDVEEYLFTHDKLPYDLANGKIEVVEFLNKYSKGTGAVLR